MRNWQLLWHLDWPRFLYVFFFVDMAAILIPVWAAALRLGDAPDSPGLDNLRDVYLDARSELQDLVDDAANRADRDGGAPEGR